MPAAARWGAAGTAGAHATPLAPPARPDHIIALDRDHAATEGRDQLPLSALAAHIAPPLTIHAAPPRSVSGTHGSRNPRRHDVPAVTHAMLDTAAFSRTDPAAFAAACRAAGADSAGLYLINWWAPTATHTAAFAKAVMAPGIRALPIITPDDTLSAHWRRQLMLVAMQRERSGRRRPSSPRPWTGSTGRLRGQAVRLPWRLRPVGGGRQPDLLPAGRSAHAQSTGGRHALHPDRSRSHRRTQTTQSPPSPGGGSHPPSATRQGR